MSEVSETLKNSPADASAILGRTIRSVIMKEVIDRDATPRSQLFLIFDDGTSYEFYCHADIIRQTKGLWNGDITRVRGYMDARMKVVFQAHLKAL